MVTYLLIAALLPLTPAIDPAACAVSTASPPPDRYAACLASPALPLAERLRIVAHARVTGPQAAAVAGLRASAFVVDVRLRDAVLDALVALGALPAERLSLVPDAPSLLRHVWQALRRRASVHGATAGSYGRPVAPNDLKRISPEDCRLTDPTADGLGMTCRTFLSCGPDGTEFVVEAKATVGARGWAIEGGYLRSPSERAPCKPKAGAR